MASGIPPTSQQAAELSRALRDGNPLSCPPDLIPTVVPALLASVDPYRARSHLLRYLECLGDASVFWEACREQSEFLRGVTVIFASSYYLSGILWRDPQLAFWLRDEALYAPPTPRNDLEAQLSVMLEGQEDEAQVAAVLRRFTQRHLLRLGARDLNRLADVDETTAGLAALADCVLQAGRTGLPGLADGAARRAGLH